MLRGIFFAVFVFLSGPVLAQSLDLSLSNDSVQIRFARLTGNPTGLGHTEMDLGALYSSGRGAATDRVLAMAGLMVIGNAGSGIPGLEVGVGAEFFAAAIDSVNVAALALGGQLRFHPKAVERLGLSARLHYAPNIVTFIDADSFIYGSLQLEYEILPQALAYIGYRKAWASISSGPDVTIDNGGHIGMQIIF